MADKPCVQRLQKEFRSLCKDPVPQVSARPSPTDILEWHYVLEGVKGSDFEKGVYHGKLKFPPDYPFKPPSITMITPNGRFAPSKRICMSMSDFHPETWNPMWSVASILTGLLSFMTDTAPTTGSVHSSAAEKRRFASHSLEFNCTKSPVFRKLFPEYVQRYEEQRAAAARAKADALAKASSGAATAGKGGREGDAAAGSDGGREGQQQQDQQLQQRPGGAKSVYNIPLFVKALLVAICGVIIALPILTLDVRQ
eukprot:TRINITY_DN22920_c0_g1_i1.p1 TRINITY_DN22920_c0_g1~~TRINITY_DN22920_c0_g1_i1.p1  ORF type:complete len:254 (-),score=44.60 TRINITY_DN22920_c0_g1_i1:99-860(-)